MRLLLALLLTALPLVCAISGDLTAQGVNFDNVDQMRRLRHTVFSLVAIEEELKRLQSTLAEKVARDSQAASDTEKAIRREAIGRLEKEIATAQAHLLAQERR